jgi:hypothetical protein
LLIQSLGFAREVTPTTLKVRLLTGLSTYSVKAGAPFTTVAIAPFEADGRVVIPRGSLICGSIRKAQRVGFGLVHERASLSLNFDHYELPDGEEFPLEARLASVDNSREQVKPDGTIQGILAARNPNGLINGFWYKPDFSLFYRSLIGLTGAADQLVARFDMGPFGAAAFLALHCTMFRFPEPEIRLPPGTDLELNAHVTASHVPSFAPDQPEPLPGELANFVEDQPREVTRGDHARAPDIINVAFIGSKQELTQAFLNAGWFPTDRVTLRTFSRVYASFSAMQTYRTAPVSKLLYRGAAPELVFQKSLNTVSKRHHVRIWHAGMYAGQDVWLGAATHDTGVTFRPMAIEFQHKIDPDIDHERSKIVNDLLFAGCSRSVGYIDPGSASAQDHDISTDSRIAVLFIGSCTDDQDYPGVAGMKGPGSWMVRLSRRLILETRNYLIREQPYYWGYEILRWRRSPFSNESRTAPNPTPPPADAQTPGTGVAYDSAAVNGPQPARHSLNP